MARQKGPRKTLCMVDSAKCTKKKRPGAKKLRQATGKGLASKEPFGSHGMVRRGGMGGIGGICTNSMKSTCGEKIAMGNRELAKKRLGGIRQAFR
jgi:hypothetical protein